MNQLLTYLFQMIDLQKDAKGVENVSPAQPHAD
jgi:hypothetical protein